eukprot:2597437-Amphidinium_carterae.1
MNETERWDYKVADWQTGAPWDYNEHDKPGEAVTAAPPVLVPAEMVPVVARPPTERLFKRHNVERYGAYPYTQVARHVRRSCRAARSPCLTPKPA